jgi:hypothetical protein
MLSMGRQDTVARVLSFIENPVNPQEERQIFLQKAGDWTCKVHAILQRDTVRPAWIQGPFRGPYASAEEYDNQILVASGIGITPALSVIRAQKDSRRILWVVERLVLTLHWSGVSVMSDELEVSILDGNEYIMYISSLSLVASPFVFYGIALR